MASPEEVRGKYTEITSHYVYLNLSISLKACTPCTYKHHGMMKRTLPWSSQLGGWLALSGIRSETIQPLTIACRDHDTQQGRHGGSVTALNQAHRQHDSPYRRNVRYLSFTAVIASCMFIPLFRGGGGSIFQEALKWPQTHCLPSHCLWGGKSDQSKTGPYISSIWRTPNPTWYTVPIPPFKTSNLW